MWSGALDRTVAVALAAAGCGGGRPGPPPAPCDERFNTFEATIGELQAAIRSGRTTCRAVTQGYLTQIARFDQPLGINAITALVPTALDRADRADRALARGDAVGPLFCAPIVVKDNIDVAGLATTAGSVALAGNIARADAFVVARLEAAGAIVLAKTNMSEWGLIADTTHSSTAGTTANVYAFDHVAAGSSGGTASAVAASFAAAGIGTDTGLSIRGPSSHLALVGIRPTLGLTSRSGLVPVFRDRDVAGPMARTVEDAARLLQAMVGEDRADAMTRLARGQPVADYTASLDAGGLAGARIGVWRVMLDGNVDSEIARLFEAALRDLAARGATLIDPFAVDDIASFRDDPDLVCERFRYDLFHYLRGRGDAVDFDDIATVVATGAHTPAVAGLLRRLASRPLDVPPEQWPTPCPTYPAHPRRAAFLAAVVAAMDRDQLDAVVYPTWTKMPAHHVARIAEGGGDGGQFVSPATGQPAITVPMGFSMDSLPIGLELLGRPFAEDVLLRLAYAYEQATHHRHPPPRFEPRFVPGCLGDRTLLRRE